jgi:hypothetical protein
MTIPELLPCPFCGGAMQPRDALWPSEGDTDGIIHANPTDCPLPEFSIQVADEGVSVAAAWNKRAQPLMGVERAALPPLRAREEIPEDVVLAFMRRSNLPSRAILEMTVTEWKDGIDIQRPSHSTMEFARALFTAGQEWREPEGWQLVPKELTEDMAAEIECSDGTDEGWRRALAARPPLPAPPVAEPIVAEKQTEIKP